MNFFLQDSTSHFSHFHFIHKSAKIYMYAYTFIHSQIYVQKLFIRCMMV